jgi:hypothetical protein
MSLPLLFVLLALQSQSIVSFTCGVSDAQTSVRRSSAGYTAVLKVHSEDDHGKNTHLCGADYTLQATRPDGTALAPSSILYSDDAWNRPIDFRIEGFSPDGHTVFALISEDKHPSSIDAVQFDMASGRKLKDVFLDGHFTSSLSPACAATLYIAGLSPAGLMVLASSRKDGCSADQLWELAPNKTTGAKGGRILPEYPHTISSNRGIIALDRGQSIGP